LGGTENRHILSPGTKKKRPNATPQRVTPERKKLRGICTRKIWVRETANVENTKTDMGHGNEGGGTPRKKKTAGEKRSSLITPGGGIKKQKIMPTFQRQKGITPGGEVGPAGKGGWARGKRVTQTEVNLVKRKRGHAQYHFQTE